MSLLQFTPIIRLFREMCCYNLELQLERQLDPGRVATWYRRIMRNFVARMVQCVVLRNEQRPGCCRNGWHQNTSFTPNRK